MNELQANKYFLFHGSNNISNRGAEIHYHSCFEIYYLTDGACDSIVDNKIYHMSPGDIVIIPPGAIHGTRYLTEKHGRILLNFSFHYLPKSLGEALSKESRIYGCGETKEEIEQIFAKIEKEYRGGDDYSEEAIIALLSQLAILILRDAPKNDEAVPQYSFIEIAVKYIHDNYQNPMTLGDIAKACNVSKVHLSRKFKERLGIGVSEYVAMYRLKKAKELLLSQDKMSVCEVAYGCGFNDSNYFSALFKKTYGVSPSGYRKNARL